MPIRSAQRPFHIYQLYRYRSLALVKGFPVLASGFNKAAAGNGVFLQILGLADLRSTS